VKIILLSLFLLVALPFIVKLTVMSYLVYKHYFISMANSKFPIGFKQLFNLLHGDRKHREEEGGRRPIGFDTTFTEQDKVRLETARSKKR